MINDNQLFFKRLSQHHALTTNLFSIILAKNPSLDLSRREAFYDIVSPYYGIHSLSQRNELVPQSEQDTSEVSAWLNKDLRIKNIRLKAIRGFPDSSTPYGINFFSGTSEAASMIILGGNASGKSSIYDAIEYVYCRTVGEAQLRSGSPFLDEDPKYKEFLRHLNRPYTDAWCEIETISNKMTLNGINIPKHIRAKINPQNHFISDNDIYSFGQIDYTGNGADSFHNLIARNIGLSDLLEVEKHLYAITAYKRTTESSRYNAIAKDVDNNTSRLATLKKAVEESDEKLRSLLIEDPLSDSADVSKATKLKEILIRARGVNHPQFKINSSLNSYIQKYLATYQQISANPQQELSLKELQFLETGLELLPHSDDCPLCQQSKLSKSDLQNSLELRIRETRKANMLSKELTDYSNILIEYFNALHRDLVSIHSLVKNEQQSLKGEASFDSLLQIVNFYESEIAAALTEEFMTDITGIENNERFNKDKFALIHQLLVRHQDHIQLFQDKIHRAHAKFIEDRQNMLEQLIARASPVDPSTTIDGKMAILKNEIENYLRQISQVEEQLNRNNDELKIAKTKLDLVLRIKEETTEYYKVFHAELAKEVEKAFEPIKGIVLSILGEYLYEEDRPVDLVIEKHVEATDPETGAVISEIIRAYVKERGADGPPISVNRYFNTFHYRLFSTMVGVSIAIASRQQMRVNLPLILDDIFYASDFENRATVERFVHKLFSLFRDYSNEMRLQLILFTHDQLIFESIIESHMPFKEENDILFCKLFPAQEAQLGDNYKQIAYQFSNQSMRKTLSQLLIPNETNT